MILNTHTNAKVLMRTYQGLMAQAVIDRDRVSTEQAQWLGIPPEVGTGAYNDQARGWLDCPSWDGNVQRFTPSDGPKGASP